MCARRSSRAANRSTSTHYHPSEMPEIMSNIAVELDGETASGLTFPCNHSAPAPHRKHLPISILSLPGNGEHVVRFKIIRMVCFSNPYTGATRVLSSCPQPIDTRWATLPTRIENRTIRSTLTGGLLTFSVHCVLLCCPPEGEPGRSGYIPILHSCSQSGQQVQYSASSLLLISAWYGQPCASVAGFLWQDGHRPESSGAGDDSPALFGVVSELMASFPGQSPLDFDHWALYATYLIIVVDAR